MATPSLNYSGGGDGVDAIFLILSLSLSLRSEQPNNSASFHIRLFVAVANGKYGAGC